jgi:hypothetical protein
MLWWTLLLVPLTSGLTVDSPDSLSGLHVATTVVGKFFGPEFGYNLTAEAK